MPFKAGDTVRLKSGGPQMTVLGNANATAGGGLLCAWFDQKDGVSTLQRTGIPEVALQAADERIVVQYVNPDGSSAGEDV